MDGLRNMLLAESAEPGGGRFAAELIFIGESELRRLQENLIFVGRLIFIGRGW
jgi:hypothetical protein